MGKPLVFTRPTFDEAFKAWQTILRERSFATDCLWLFEENLCFEKAAGGQPARSSAFKLAYQTGITPPPRDAERIAYRYFAQFERPVVFYRIGSASGKSLCLLLCDAWFEGRGQEQGFIHRDDWLVYYCPGEPIEIEETSDEARWNARIVRGRPLHPLDFCMSLRAIHETLAHGRVLSPYEHYALKFLNTWKHFLPHKNRVDN